MTGVPPFVRYRLDPAAVRAVFVLYAVAMAAAGYAADADRLLVVNKSDHSVSILDLASGATIARVPTGKGPHEIAVSPDGRWAAVSDYGPDDTAGGSLTLFPVQAPREARTIPLGDWLRPHGLAWLADSRHLLVTSEAAGALVLVDAARGRVTEAIATTQALSHMVAFDSKRNRAYVGNIDSGTLSVIDMASRRLHMVVPTGRGTEGVGIAPGTGDIWVTNREDHEVAIVDPDQLRVKRRLAAGAMPVRVAFTPDGRLALVTNARGASLSVYRVEPPAFLTEIDLSGRYRIANGRRLGGWFGRQVLPVGVTSSRDGRRAYVSSTFGGLVVEVDLRALEVVGTLAAGREPDGLAYWEGH